MLHPGRYKKHEKKINHVCLHFNPEILSAQWIIATSSIASGRINFILNCGGLCVHHNVPNPVHLGLGESIAYTHKMKTLNSVLDRHQVFCLTKNSGANLRFRVLGYKI